VDSHALDYEDMRWNTQLSEIANWILDEWLDEVVNDLGTIRSNRGERVPGYFSSLEERCRRLVAFYVNCHQRNIVVELLARAARRP
jgi:hypothetical protein